MEEFLKLFFDEGETFCVSPNKYAYHSVAIESFKENKVNLVSPNPDVLPTVAPFTDMALMGLNPIKGFRSDDSCTAFRNFLIEMDEGTLKEQWDYIRSIKLPYSCVVFSGGKSLHFGIALDQNLGSLETYKHVAKWLLAIASKADQQTGNPSRCIRMPGTQRGDQKQALLEIKKRISLADLNSFLSKNKKFRPKIEEKIEYIQPVKSDGKLPYWTVKALKDVNSWAAKKGEGRNQTWFKIFAAFGEAGLTAEEAISATSPNFSPEKDFKRREWIGIAKSAIKRVTKGKQ